jgi:hypothetical protein
MLLPQAAIDAVGRLVSPLRDFQPFCPRKLSVNQVVMLSGSSTCFAARQRQHHRDLLNQLFIGKPQSGLDTQCAKSRLK